MASRLESPAEHDLIIPADLTRVADVRRLLEVLAEEIGFHPSRRFDIAVAVSEAVANAIEHASASGEVRIQIDRRDDRLEVQVSGPGEFHLPTASSGREHRGLGLPLMATLADHLALYSGSNGGTLVALTFFREGRGVAQRGREPLPPGHVELREENLLLSTILDSAPLGIFVLGPDLRARWANPRTQTFLEEPYRNHALSGAFIGDVLPGVEETSLEILRHVSQTGEPFSTDEFAFYGFQRGPTYWRVQAAALPTAGQEPPYDVLVLLQDITPNKSVERERLQLLAELPSGFALHELIVDEQGRPADYRFLEVNKAFEELTGLRGQDIIGRRALEVLPGLEPVWIQLYGGVAQGGGPIHFEDYSRPLDRFYEVTAYSPAPGRFAAIFNDVTLRKRQESALRESEERFRASFEQAAVGTALIAQDGTFLRVNQRFADITGHTVNEFDDVHFEDLTLDEDRKANRLCMGRLVAGEVHDCTFEQRFVRKDGSLVWVKLTGSLVSEPGTAEAYLMAVAEDISSRKEAEDKAEEERRRTTLLQEAAVTLSQSLDLTRVLDVFADILLQLIGRERLNICLLDPPSADLVVAVGKGTGAVRSGVRFSLADLAPEYAAVVQQQRSVVIDYLNSDRPRRRRAGLEDSSAMLILVVPLVYKGDTIGLISLDTPGQYRPFNQAEIQLVEGMASQASTAIETARLYEAQKTIADALQASVLLRPADIPELQVAHAYRSATEAAHVGGDFYDVFSPQDGIVFMAIADVCGHGVRAATQASLVRDMLRAYGQLGLPLDELLEVANDMLLRQRPNEPYVTVFLARLDLRSGLLDYVSAGHPPALLCRDRQCMLLHRPSPPLGTLSGVHFEPGRAQLGPGDLLVLYTDGVTEARSGDRFLGEQGLLDTVSRGPDDVDALAEEILKTVLNFSDSTLRDDVALLLVRRPDDRAGDET